MEKEEFNELFNYILKNTNNFKKFDSDLLENNPRSILILRLMLNLGQKGFCGLTNLSKGYLYLMESGKLKKINKSYSKKIIPVLKNKIKELDLKCINSNLLYERYILFQDYSKLDRKRSQEIRSRVLPENNVQKGLNARNKCFPENEFEAMIMGILSKNKIEFELHSIIRAQNKKVVVDFAIPSSKDPRIIIEVKQSRSKNIKRQYDLLHGYAIVLDHKIRHIKLKHPKIKSVVVLSSKYKPIKKLSPFIIAEFLDADKIFIDSNLNEIVDYIKGLNSKI